ncbi:MAG: hypothetical protein QOJ16_4544 [Acidobacteriota bacterium]|jgi:hypothetical protein|nr:hypothetical protein [Acidobacteriota bacterium]
MKMKLIVVAVVLAALVLPGASWALWPSCSTCGQLAPGASCTCPGTGPYYRFTTCDKYPRGCDLQFKSSGGPQSEKDAFLASFAEEDSVLVAVQPAASPAR